MAEVRVKVFSRDLQKNLFPDNAFYKKSKKDSPSSAESIDIPQAQAQASAVIGNVQIDYDTAGNNLSDADELKVIKRINTLLSYANQNFFVPPIVIDKNNQDGELSYSKQQEIREEMSLELNTQIANWSAVKWSPAQVANMVKTSGTDTRTCQVVGGFAGQVKRTTFQDILNVKKAFQKMNLPAGQIFVLPTPEFWEDIMLLPEFRDFEKTGMTTLLKTGTIGRWLGMTWFEPRHNGALNANILYDDATPATPSKIDYQPAVVDGRTVQVITPNATTVSGCLFWHEKMVRRSEGNVNVYFDPNNPTYQGDILSSNVRYGASNGRADEKGIIALIEETSA